ncbi:hypothetical protein EVAR_34287_1 [Eumeta japonica]|uniref:Uncharacterized protein n=1 Tax=Eumeta variegata TaxID=151549 RepID=A0A4C1VX21_EUMVA|nr:hypothetical protein EVAR_34287_1 [Eumeta japonica]
MFVERDIGPPNFILLNSFKYSENFCCLLHSTILSIRRPAFIQVIIVQCRPCDLVHRNRFIGALTKNNIAHIFPVRSSGSSRCARKSDAVIVPDDRVPARPGSIPGRAGTRPPVERGYAHGAPRVILAGALSEHLIRLTGFDMSYVVLRRAIRPLCVL